LCAETALVEQVYRYCKDNLALVNVYIKSPVVTKIKRDQKIPVIWFIANLGGILGLCLGFSVITVSRGGDFKRLRFIFQLFEIVPFLVLSVKDLIKEFSWFLARRSLSESI
jgi:hypothetical protein